jgi:hypothetical protein
LWYDRSETQMSEWPGEQTSAAFGSQFPSAAAASIFDPLARASEQNNPECDHSSAISLQSKGSDTGASSADGWLAELNTNDQGDQAWLSPGKPTVTTDDILSIKGASLPFWAVWRTSQPDATGGLNYNSFHTPAFAAVTCLATWSFAFLVFLIACLPFRDAELKKHGAAV